MKNKEIVTKLLEKIELVQEMIRSIDAITCMLSGSDFRHRKPDRGNLRELLVEEELECWRNIFMWAMTLGEKERDRIKAAAHERFLGKQMSVGYWLGNASSWTKASEDEFREMARKAFAPGEES